MKGVLGFLLTIALVAFGFFISTSTGQDTRLHNMSRVITFLLIVLGILILVKRHKVNIVKEIKTFFAFKRESDAFKRSMRIVAGGTIIPIFIAVFVIAPLITFSLVKVNATSYHACYLAKNRVKKVYTTGSPKKKHFVDIYYDGRPLTIRISRKTKKHIERRSQVPNLKRGALGFYYIEE